LSALLRRIITSSVILPEISLKANTMAHIIPFSDSHVENERMERDAAFVIRENQEMNHVSENIPIKSP
jgi:hypothetical protein